MIDDQKKFESILVNVFTLVAMPAVAKNYIGLEPAAERNAEISRISYELGEEMLAEGKRRGHIPENLKEWIG
jgi:hypothetical protein